jgi:glycerophosphoryl diester phosphodiesterase
MSWKECTSDRAKVCKRTEDDSYNQCTEQRDAGYNECTQSRDDGYRNCCDWAPCSWFCDAWVWLSHIVCVVWTWISNVVCVVWTWIKNIVCVVWVYLTALICMIPGIGKYITDFLDGVLRIVLAVISAVIGGLIDFITHPIDSIGTIIGLFGGCPSVRASANAPLQVIAHHGAPLELPENTIQSCERALNLGANALEVDICMTSDQQLILWHDWDPDALISVTRQAELAQTDNAFKPHVPPLGDEWRKPTIELTLAEFRAHFSYEDERDAVTKVKWNIDHGSVDLTIPTLGEFFAAASHWSGLRVVYLDIKMPASAAIQFAGPMTDQIHAFLATTHEVEFKVIVMVPDSVVLQVMKARAQQMSYPLVFTWDVEFPPGIILNPKKYSAIDHATSSLFHNAAASVGEPVASLFPWRVYRQTIAYDIGRWNQVNANPATGNNGVRIDSLVAWTIDDKDEMTCLAQMGVTGIITNKIADLVAVAAATGR